MCSYLRDKALKGSVSDSSSYQNQLLLSEPGVRNAGPIPDIPVSVNVKYKRAEGAAMRSSTEPTNRTRNQRASIHPSIHPSTDTTNRNSQRNMKMSSIPLCGLLLIFNLQLFSSYPINPGLTETDMDILKVILHKLEESELEQTELNRGGPADGLDSMDLVETSDGEQTQTGLDEAAIRELLSAKNLKNVRNNDSSRRTSGCFGRRMDRIGSMSSLGCNTVGKYNPK